MEISQKLKEKLNSCSRCALCNSICPAFKETKNECCSLKGKVLMLIGIAENKFQFKPVVKKYFDQCINCKNIYECEKICPSEIKISELLNYIKNKF